MFLALINNFVVEDESRVTSQHLFTEGEDSWSKVDDECLEAVGCLLSSSTFQSNLFNQRLMLMKKKIWLITEGDWKWKIKEDRPSRVWDESLIRLLPNSSWFSGNRGGRRPTATFSSIEDRTNKKQGFENQPLDRPKVFTKEKTMLTEGLIQPKVGRRKKKSRRLVHLGRSPDQIGEPTWRRLPSLLSS